MNKNIIVYSLILILIILIIYLFLGFRQLSSTVSDNDPQSPTSSNLSNIDLSNYYTKSEIDSSFSTTKSYVDTNIHNSISTIRTDQGGNMFHHAGAKELGYEVGLDGKINFLSPVEFKENVDFNHDKWINSLPRGSIIAWNVSPNSYPPKGWAHCNGEYYKTDNNGNLQWVSMDQGPTTDGAIKTPDLRARFILGGDDMHNGDGREEYRFGEAGGEEDVTLTTQQMPTHKHKLDNFKFIREGNLLPEPPCRNPCPDGFHGIHNKTHRNEGWNEKWGKGLGLPSDGYGIGIPLDKVGLQTDAVTHRGGMIPGHSNNFGDGQSHNNMPPFNVLTYIMKI
jgi:microcystin-dependent protein